MVDVDDDQSAPHSVIGRFCAHTGSNVATWWSSGSSPIIPTCRRTRKDLLLGRRDLVQAMFEIEGPHSDDGIVAFNTSTSSRTGSGPTSGRRA
ncbi:hypothetical protein [Actinomadura roseirufa]|uniref:hypothetical protein n=1 Tax=Actinomadura roseirufa TaxID=2094049 RepID=UPI001040FAE1|nr:hypothetical protein [Actinomadura roseirufa]